MNSTATTRPTAECLCGNTEHFIVDDTSITCAKCNQVIWKEGEPAPATPLELQINLPVTIANLMDYFKTVINDPATTAEYHRTFFQCFIGSKAAILAELKKWKKDQLSRLASHSATKKPEMIASAWRHLQTEFALADGGIQYGFGDKYEDVIAGYVAKVTDETLVQYRAERVARRQAREEQRAEVSRATDSPQTLADFETCIRSRGIKKINADEMPVPRKQYDIEVLIRKTGLKELTEPELELFDELMAAKAAEARAEKMVDRATVKRIEIGDGNYMEVMKSYHTKRECDTWLVILAEREDRTTFEELCIAARKLGGNYSRAWEERPGGFQFFSEEQAEKFVMLQSKDIFEMSRLEKLIRHRERIRGNAIGHFVGLADRMEDRAETKLDDIAGRNLNTERRIMQAERSTDQAHESIAMAGTLRNYATALQQRLTRHTDRIRWRTHAECFDEILAGAGHHIPAVEYPWPTVGSHALLEIVKEVGDKDGSILISRRIAKMAQESGAVVTFEGNAAADTLRHFYRRARLHRTSRWALDRVRESMGNFKRLRLMNIDSLPELRAALREHKGRRVTSDALTRAQKVMLDLYLGQFPPDYFPTPIDVVELMLDYADIEDGMTILEPSAGSGHIANVLRERYLSSPIALVEISGMLCRALEAQEWKPIQADFMQWTPPENSQTGLPNQVDRIIMNPPFGCDGVGTDIDHVRHAFEMLAPGGRLVSVMSDGVFYRGDAKAQEFRSWLEFLDGMDFELPEGAFLNSDRPTSWASRIVVINKPLADAEAVDNL